MKKQFTLLCLFLVSTAGHAHIKAGVYSGSMTDGQACSMQIVEKFFEHNIEQPLNERVRVRVENDEYVLAHPPVIDMESGAVSFNHELLQGVLGSKDGAKALIVEMSHRRGHDGPKEFAVLDNDWKTEQKSVVKCLNLKFMSK